MVALAVRLHREWELQNSAAAAALELVSMLVMVADHQPGQPRTGTTPARQQLLRRNLALARQQAAEEAAGAELLLRLSELPAARRAEAGAAEEN